MRHSSLAEFAEGLELPRPVLRKQAGRHVAVKRGERPIAYARDKSVLHGIDVAIFNLTAVVLVIPDQVLSATIEEICREKPASSGDECAPVIWHAAG